MSFTNPYPASRLTVDTANSLANGLVAFYPLTDGTGSTAKDITSNANDGTASGTVNWLNDDIGYAADFNGVTGYFDTGIGTSSIGLSSVNTGTVSAWVKYTTSGSVTQNVFADLGSGGAAPNFGFYIFPGSFAVDVWRNESGSRFGGITYSGWMHFVAVYDSTSTTIYVNGVQAGTAASSGTFNSSSSNFMIGNQPANNRNLEGQIQNIRVYNRALSATEVATLYNRPWEGTNYGTLWPYSPPVPSSATLSTDTAATSLNVDLEGWWLTTDNTGTTLVDISGNGRDATLYGTNSWVADSVGTVNRFDNSSSSGNNARTAQHQIGLSNYTVAFWINNEDAGVSGAKYGGGFCLTDGSGPPSVSDVEVYFRRDTSNQWPQLIHNRSNGGTLGSFTVSESNKASQKDVWKFWVITFDGTNARVYRDGSLISTSGTLAAPLSTTGKHIVINGVQDSSTGLTCSMQNIRLYSRALSADEITLLYERPFEGITYGDAFHYDPPTPANLTPLTSDTINNSQEIWLPLTDGTGTTAVDISGNGNNGTLTGTSGNVPAWHVGRLGSSVEGDGTNARRVEISNTALSAVSAMSVSCWIFNDAVNNYEVYFGYGQLNYLFALQRVATQDVLRFLTIGLTGNTDLRTPAGTLKTGVWQHVVGTYDGSTKKIYFDGVEVASASSTGSITQPTNNTAILSAAGSGFDVDGKMTNVRLWSRSLTSQEVWDIYSNAWLGSAYQASAAAVYYNYILRSKRFRRLS